MKKVFLSIFVVVTFVLYSYHARYGDASSVIKPPAINQNPSTATNSSSNNTEDDSGSVSAPTSTSMHSTMMATYKDGTYTGSVGDAFYGNIQVKAVISGGKITDVIFLQYPNDRANSVRINTQAMPYLKQEAIAAQSANVNIISGATDSSMAFIQSLSDALKQAKG